MWCQRTRAYILYEIPGNVIMLMIIFVTKTNFIEIGNELVTIHVSTKDEEEKLKKNTKTGKFPLRCVPKVRERSFQERISIFPQKNKPEKCVFFRIFCPNHERICKNAFVTEIVFFHFYALEYEKKVHFFHFVLACFSRSPRYIAKKDRKKWQMTFHPGMSKKKSKIKQEISSFCFFSAVFRDHPGMLKKNSKTRSPRYVQFFDILVSSFAIFFDLFLRYTGVISKDKPKKVSFFVVF